MKSPIRFSKASGSTRQLVVRVLARGWRPGVGRIGDFARRGQPAKPQGRVNAAGVLR